MSIQRLMCCGVLIVGTCLAGLACGPTTEAQAQQAPQLQEGQPEGAFCGGIAGFTCAAGLTCVDDPNDGCDPERGGADCGGICQKQRKPECTGQDRDPAQKYVSKDPAQCALIRFKCKDGFTYFSNDCGCGCQKVKKACDYKDPDRSYIARDPATCMVIDFLCVEGFMPFFDDCGCGCETPP